MQTKKNLLKRFAYSWRIITRESRYYFQRVLAITILSVCPSVCLSVTRVDQSKTEQARITIFTISCLEDCSFRNLKLFHKFEGSHPKRGH